MIKSETCRSHSCITLDVSILISILFHELIYGQVSCIASFSSLDVLIKQFILSFSNLYFHNQSYYRYLNLRKNIQYESKCQCKTLMSFKEKKYCLMIHTGLDVVPYIFPRKRTKIYFIFKNPFIFKKRIYPY